MKLEVFGGGTHYGKAFELLRSEIEKGVRTLKRDDFNVIRPAVFFITDAEPNDNEKNRNEAFNSLTDEDFPPHPNIVPFGVGEATEGTLKPYVAHEGRAFIAKSGEDAVKSLLTIIEAIIRSIIHSATAGKFMPPDEDIDLTVIGD